MQTMSKETRIEAEHGIICSFPRDFFGYFGWPSVTRMNDGTLAAVASGLRNEHVCPFGRTVICFSQDRGDSWSSPRVVNCTFLWNFAVALDGGEGEGGAISNIRSNPEVVNCSFIGNISGAEGGRCMVMRAALG